MIAVALPMLGAAAVYPLSRKNPKHAVWVMLIASGAAFAVLTSLLWQSSQGNNTSFTWEHFCVMGLALETDGFRTLYAWLAGLGWVVTSVFSFQYLRQKANVPRYAVFTLLTLGAVIGIFLSDQLLTTMVFFEIMSLSSYAWVAHDETPEALRAAQTYLWIAVIGGLCLMMGLLLMPQELLASRYSDGSAVLDGVNQNRLMTAAVLMLIGFGAKAGAFPLHVWLPKAHPVAPAPASALLSGMLIKTGVFGVLILSAKFMHEIESWDVLIFWIGVMTMLTGAVLALLSVDMKRILACSSMSQIGFILIGAGLYGLLGHHGSIAAQGLVQHMVNHTLFKLILFLCAGVVAMQTHRLHLHDIRGFGKRKPLFHLLFLSGMLGIAGMPLFSGFASKSLLHEGLLEYIHLVDGSLLYTAAEWLFVLTGGLTLAYMLKLYICLFWEGEAWPKTRYLIKPPALLLSVCAGAIVLFGLFPSVFMSGISRLSAPFLHIEAEDVVYYSAENILGAGKSLAIGLAVYGLLVRGLLSAKVNGKRMYIDRKPVWLDLENRVYRPVIHVLVTGVSVVCMVIGALPELVMTGYRRVLLHVRAWRVPMPGGNRLTSGLGAVMNGIVWFLNKTIRRKRPVDLDFVCALAASNEMINRSTKRLKGSMSYNLLLSCIGLFLLLAYLLLW